MQKERDMQAVVYMAEVQNSMFVPHLLVLLSRIRDHKKLRFRIGFGVELADTPIYAVMYPFPLLSARCRPNIYTSRLCHDASLSVCPSVCDGSALAHYS